MDRKGPTNHFSNLDNCSSKLKTIDILSKSVPEKHTASYYLISFQAALNSDIFLREVGMEFYDGKGRALFSLLDH